MGMGQLGGYLEHCKHIVSASRAGLLITNRQIKAVLGKLHDHAPSLREMLTYADLDGDAARFRDPGLSADDPCFIQFTSGSTSKPKGVVVTHGNLAHNAWAVMREGLDSNDDDRGVSWLPLFHDMGLIGFVIAPIHHRVPVSFMSPMTFLKRPVTWLEVLSKHRGTITYGPNFSYAITQKRVRDRDLEGLDLSCVRVAGCGAEPIQADTLRAFAARNGKIGFSERAFVPSYGMAEYTLAIAFSSGVPTDRVGADALWAEGRAQPAADAETDERVDIVGIAGAFERHG
jgi:acyl-CoA synthetase (AMP-forming)/AMP-acid ligase II